MTKNQKKAALATATFFGAVFGMVALAIFAPWVAVAILCIILLCVFVFGFYIMALNEFEWAGTGEPYAPPEPNRTVVADEAESSVGRGVESGPYALSVQSKWMKPDGTF